MWAAAQGLAEFPGLNRFVAGGRLYQRKGIWISYSAKQRMQKGAPLIVLKREFEPDESFAAMVAAMGTQLQSAKFSGGEVERRRRDAARSWRCPGFLRRAVYRCCTGCSRRTGCSRSFFVDNDPLYSSVFLTDLGILGMDPAYHHLYEYGDDRHLRRARPAAHRADRRPEHGPDGAQAHRRSCGGASTSASRTASTRATGSST